MSEQPDFDHAAAHRYFAAECYNRAWGLMDKPDRTSEEDEQMIRLSLASHWHWTQRSDYAAENAAIAYWQTARIYTLLGQVDNARRHGQLCLDASRADDVPLFCLGYAYEALARAEWLAGNQTQMRAYLQEARHVTERMSDLEAKQMLLADLETIK
jgi:hypothetical protein